MGTKKDLKKAAPKKQAPKKAAPKKEAPKKEAAKKGVPKKDDKKENKVVFINGQPKFKGIIYPPFFNIEQVK